LAIATEDVKEELLQLKNIGTNDMYIKAAKIDGKEGVFFELKKGNSSSLSSTVEAFLKENGLSVDTFALDYMCVYCQFGELGMYNKFEENFGSKYDTAFLMEFVFDHRRKLKQKRISEDEDIMDLLLLPLPRLRPQAVKSGPKFGEISKLTVSGVRKTFFPFAFASENVDACLRLKFGLMTEDLIVDRLPYLQKREMNSRILYSFVKLAAFQHAGKTFLSGCQMEHPVAKLDLVLCYCLNFTCKDFPLNILAYSKSYNRYLLFRNHGNKSSDHLKYFTCLPEVNVPELMTIMEGADRFLRM